MKKNINIVCNEDINNNRLNYVIDFINNHPLKPLGVKLFLNVNLNDSDIIYYTNENVQGKIIPLQNLFFSNKKIPQVNLFANEYLLGDEKYYSVEKIKKLSYFFNVENVFAFDIFETIFFHISRYEEYFFSKNHLDKHGRMKSSEQLLVKTKLHYIPVVDHLVYGFFKILNFDMEKRKTDYTLTHDIDIIRKFSGFLKLPKSIARILLMGYGIKGVYNIVNSYFQSLKNKNNDPYYTFEWLFRKEDYFINKIVFFVAGGNTRQDLYNKYYLKELPEIIRKAKINNYEIGLHPSYNAYADEKMLKTEQELLLNFTKRRIKFIRMHFLRLDLTKSFEIIENIGFEMDSTLGYNDTIGFRAGTGFEYYPYNFGEERKWKFKELPLIIMDSALLKNCKGNPDCFEEKLIEFLKLNKFNTHICFNFHNSTFDSNKSLHKIRVFYQNIFDSDLNN